MRKAGHGIAAILAKVRKESKRRATVVMARAMGRERRFAAYDRGEDIAEIMKCSVGSLKASYHFAYQKIKDELKKYSTDF